MSTTKQEMRRARDQRYAEKLREEGGARLLNCLEKKRARQKVINAKYRKGVNKALGDANHFEDINRYLSKQAKEQKEELEIATQTIDMMGSIKRSERLYKLDIPDAKEKRDVLYKFHRAVNKAFEDYDDPDVTLATDYAIASF